MPHSNAESEHKNPQSLHVDRFSCTGSAPQNKVEPKWFVKNTVHLTVQARAPGAPNLDGNVKRSTRVPQFPSKISNEAPTVAPCSGTSAIRTGIEHLLLLLRVRPPRRPLGRLLRALLVALLLQELLVLSSRRLRLGAPLLLLRQASPLVLQHARRDQALDLGRLHRATASRNSQHRQ